MAHSAQLPRCIYNLFTRSRPVWGSWFAVLVTTIVTVGCVTTPPLESPDNEPVSTLRVPDFQSGVEPSDALVRWGGTITAMANLTDGSTQLEVVSRPLGNSGRPQRNDRTDGRFVANVEGFLDPEIVKVGRDITVLGRVNGIQEGKVGESNYRFPTVAVVNYRYWQKQVKRPQNHFPHGLNNGSYYYDPFWHGWWLHHPHRHRSGVSGQLIIRQ